jgi:glycosyltransferase involved in cell wall biosynthesis
MRILMVSHAFLPESKGGVEICTASLALALRARGHEVQILHRVGRPNRPEYEIGQGEWEGLPVTTINNTFAQVDSFEMTYRNRAIEQAFAGLLQPAQTQGARTRGAQTQGAPTQALQPDLIHFEHLTCLSTGLVEVARRQQIPAVLTLHDYWLVCQRGQMLQPDLTLCAEPEDSKCARCLAPYIQPYLKPGSIPARLAGPSSPRAIRRLGHLLTRLASRCSAPAETRQAVEQVRQRTRHVHEVMRRANLLLTPSSFHRAQFVRFGVEPERIRVQHNGLRTDLFRDFRPARTHGPTPAGRASPGDKSVRFCFLGTVIPSKGVHVAVEAFAGLRDEGATLDIYGWAPAYEGFPHYAQDLQAQAGPRVRFHGEYDNTDVASILAQADVVVIPSIWNESASLIAHEAFLAQVPVVASRLGALAEFVKHEVNGLLFEPRNAADLRAQMERLIAEPELRVRLAQNPGPVRTVEDQASELEALYQQIITGGSTNV